MMNLLQCTTQLSLNKKVKVHIKNTRGGGGGGAEGTLKLQLSFVVCLMRLVLFRGNLSD